MWFSTKIVPSKQFFSMTFAVLTRQQGHKLWIDAVFIWVHIVHPNHREALRGQALQAYQVTFLKTVWFGSLA